MLHFNEQVPPVGFCNEINEKEDSGKENFRIHGDRRMHNKLERQVYLTYSFPLIGLNW